MIYPAKPPWTQGDSSSKLGPQIVAQHRSRFGDGSPEGIPGFRKGSPKHSRRSMQLPGATFPPTWPPGDQLLRLLCQLLSAWRAAGFRCVPLGRLAAGRPLWRLEKKRSKYELSFFFTLLDWKKMGGGGGTKRRKDGKCELSCFVAFLYLKKNRGGGGTFWGQCTGNMCAFVGGALVGLISKGTFFVEGSTVKSVAARAVVGRSENHRASGCMCFFSLGG